MYRAALNLLHRLDCACSSFLPNLSEIAAEIAMHAEYTVINLCIATVTASHCAVVYPEQAASPSLITVFIHVDTLLNLALTVAE